MLPRPRHGCDPAWTTTIKEEHRPSRQVRGVLDAYEAAVGKTTIPFPT